MTRPIATIALILLGVATPTLADSGSGSASVKTDLRIVNLGTFLTLETGTISKYENTELEGSGFASSNAESFLEDGHFFGFATASGLATSPPYSLNSSSTSISGNLFRITNSTADTHSFLVGFGGSTQGSASSMGDAAGAGSGNWYYYFDCWSCGTPFSESYSGSSSALIGQYLGLGDGDVLDQDYQWLSLDFALDPGAFLDIYASFGAGAGAIALPSAIPEPSSWAMMIAGFGLVGYAARRRVLAGVSARH